MRFASPLVSGRLIRRYKRFLADVALDTGETIVAHVANPGAMLGLTEPGLRVWLSRSDSLTRKLPWSLELIGADRTIIGVHTGHPNRLVAEAIAGGAIPELSGYATVRREVAYGTRSRVDFLLAGPGRPDAYVEVKNVHLMRMKGRAEFPDSVTARGTKHLAELAKIANRGERAVMLYLVQRADAEAMSLARDIDPAYAAAFDQACAAGVEAIAYACRVTETEIAVERALPVLP